jgi:hypothetical protein
LHSELQETPTGQISKTGKWAALLFDFCVQRARPAWAAVELGARGIMNERGQPFSAASINSMLTK